MLLQDLLVPSILFFILIIILVLAKFIFRKRFRNQLGYRSHYRKNYGYIYFYQGKWEISNFFLVKIGRTNNMKQRMSAAKTSNPFGIKLLACIIVQSDVYAESFIHKKFSKYRVSKDNEWFFLNPFLLFYLWCIDDDNVTRKYK